MKKIITFVLVLSCFSAFAQWDVNPHLFESNMTVTNAIFDFDTNTVNNDSLQIVAFSGTECRGYVPFFNPHTINGQNAYFYFLMIHGQSGDSIQICVWDNASQSFWYKSPVFIFENDTIMGTPFTPNILYAGYKVTFDANGGSGAMPYQHFHHETAQNLSPNTFSRIGMHFAGWSGTPNGSVEYTDGASFSTTSDTTLYAQWEYDTYMITYHNDYGTLPNDAPDTYTYDSPTVMLPILTRGGYIFGGWYSDAQYTGNPVTDIPTHSTGDKEFWAKWCPAPISTTQSACGSYIWNGTEYTQSGDYTYSHPDTNGCTQVDTLHLTIHNPTHTAITVSECGTYTWNGIEYTQSGDYTYSHPDTNGCTQVDTLYLTLHQLQQSEFTVEVPDDCYTWNDTEYCENGDYTQVLTDEFGCDSTVTLHLTLRVGIDTHTSDNIRLYPNPVRETVRIQHSASRIQSVIIYDASGRMLNKVNVNDHTAVIDLSRHPQGTYFLRITTENGVVTNKVVKSR